MDSLNLYKATEQIFDAIDNIYNIKIKIVDLVKIYSTENNDQIKNMVKKINYNTQHNDNIDELDKNLVLLPFDEIYPYVSTYDPLYPVSGGVSTSNVGTIFHAFNKKYIEPFHDAYITGGLVSQIPNYKKDIESFIDNYYKTYKKKIVKASNAQIKDYLINYYETVFNLYYIYKINKIKIDVHNILKFLNKTTHGDGSHDDIASNVVDEVFNESIQDDDYTIYEKLYNLLEKYFGVDDKDERVALGKEIFYAQRMLKISTIESPPNNYEKTMDLIKSLYQKEITSEQKDKKFKTIIIKITKKLDDIVTKFGYTNE
jgi:hypothetical protein